MYFLKYWYAFNNSGTIASDGMQQSGHESQNLVFPIAAKFVPNKKIQDLRDRLIKFMEHHIYPRENEFYKLAQSTMRWTVHPDEEKLKELAKREGLWNLFIPVCISFQFLLAPQQGTSNTLINKN